MQEGRSVDFATQRTNMVESQVRPSDVTDRRIIRAMAAIPREAFVTEAVRDVAYMDADVPLLTAAGAGRALMAPRTFAKLAQLAEIEADDVVLDVGAATGYSAAVLARLARTVIALESDAGLAEAAKRALGRLAIDNVTVVAGDLAGGQPQDGPYDAILIEGAVPEVPRTLLEQLKDGGRLVAVHVPDHALNPLGKAVVWRRHDGTLAEGSAFDASAPALPGFERAIEFAF
jgi:protein-L-isoaspartate(D-aspartate) O-methyltransferase